MAREGTAREKFSSLYTKQHLQDLWLDMDQKKIAKKTGFTTKTIYRHIKKWNLEKHGSGCTSRPWDILEEDNELINYFGGFLYADGCLSKTSITSYALQLTVKNEDHEIIDLLHSKIPYSCVGSYIQASGKMCYLRINGADLSEKLLKFGITSDKRYSWTRPNVSNEMLPHFLRGWYDGDGSIGKKKYVMTLTNINEDAIKYFEEKIRFLGYSGIGIKGPGSGHSRIYMTPTYTKNKEKRNKDAWRHTITGEINCKKMYKLLKCDSKIRLNRKWSLLE